MKTIALKTTLFFMLLFGVASCELESSKLPYNEYEGLYDLYLYDVETGETTNVTASPNESEAYYSISPDSESILYVNTLGVNQMNIDGTGNELLVADGTSPAYSPDGSQIAYVKNNRLYIMDADGSNANEICDDFESISYPLWSGDGKYIACLAESQLRIIPLEGDGQPFAIGAVTDWFDWSHDSEEIFYSRYVTDNYAQVFKYNLAEDEETQVTDIDKYNYYAVCHPTLDKVLFTSVHANYGGDLVTVDFDGENKDVILHKNYLAAPCWSPSGEQIAFITDNSNLAIVDSDGNNYEVVNSIPYACLRPNWSSDGKYILYNRAIYYAK